MFFAGLFRHVEMATAVVPILWWQLWRFITFQFIHAGAVHLFFNMLGLYMLGTILERSWGTKRFLRFYLGCGVVAGLCHVAMAFILNLGGIQTRIPLVGASGGVFGIVVACAVLYPQIRLILILFPVPDTLRSAAFHRRGGLQHTSRHGSRRCGRRGIRRRASRRRRGRGDICPGHAGAQTRRRRGRRQARPGRVETQAGAARPRAGRGGPNTGQDSP